LFKKTQEIERQLIETQRLNQELDERNRAITALHANITELATAEAALRREVLQWQQAEETLRLAMEAIGREMQAKSEFLSGVSHELRTPLTAVLGYAALLGKTDLAPKQRKYVESISTAGRHLLELIDEVLDITRLEVDRLTIALEPVALRPAFDVVRYMIVPLAGQRHVQLVDSLPEDRDVHVQADPQRLKQVLLNLLSNAVKYNKSGGRVTITCAGVPEDRVRICIADTGVGIPTDKLDRLFTPFDRLGAEHSGVEGTGLGLALCKRLVEAMGGTIGVDSVVAQGSTFWVELPVADPAAPEPVQTGAANGAGEGG
jgi:signal transduction histidine kinase